MSHPSKEKVGDLIGFKWGRQRGVGKKNKGVRFFESFVYEGVEYCLYDCVYFFHVDQVETSIGKLVRLYETPDYKKMVKVVWFLRPSEVHNFLGNYRPRWNELFLASGVGKGVSNVNLLESIIGKCSVVCTSKDKRNPEPSKADINKADFFFDCTFDVGRHAIIDKFADEIDRVKVEHFFNRKRGEKKGNHVHAGKTVTPKTEMNTRTDCFDMLHCQVKDKAEVIHVGKTVTPNTATPKTEMNTTTDCFDMLHCQVKDKAEVRTSENGFPEKSSPSFPFKKRKIIIKRSTVSQICESPEEGEIVEKKAELIQDEKAKTYGKVIEVTERPNSEKKRWFTNKHRDEILQRDKNLDTLVLLNNLDPSFTSDEVEDLVWHALKEKVTARMIEWSLTFNPYYGRALVVFKTKDAAESAISELNRRCLILGDGRVVSAEKGILTEPDNRSKFLGHYVIDRVKPHKQRQEMRNAKSTSHCSQPNTVEYGMAIEWQLEYDKANAQRNALYQKQVQEIEDVKSKLNMDRIFFKSDSSLT